MNFEHTFKNQNYEYNKLEFNDIKTLNKPSLIVNKLSSDDFIGIKEDILSF